MKTKREIEEEIIALEHEDVSWTVAGINTKFPESQAMIDALKWVIE